MIVLIDTDVLIDVALDRQPFADHAAAVLDAAQRGTLQAFIAWHSLANFYYIVSTPSGNPAAREFIGELLDFIEVAPVSTDDARYALSLKLNDFEDALQVAAAQASHAGRILTRNLKHYRKSPIPAETPQQFGKSLS